MESEIEETDYDSVEETSSVLSTEEWEDESDSWETDNGLTPEDDSHINNADATDTATPTPTPTGSTTFIIPPQEGSKAVVTSPTKGVSGEEGEASVAVASPASGGGGGRSLTLTYVHLPCDSSVFVLHTIKMLALGTAVTNICGEKRLLDEGG